LVRLAIGTRGWYDDVAATQSRGIAIAALSCAGHDRVDTFGTVVVVVDVGTEVVVDVGDVDVVVGATVVTTVVEGMVVVVVVVVVVAHELGIVVVVVASAGSSWADVVDTIVSTTIVLRTNESRDPRRSQWFPRRVTQRIYNASLRCPIRSRRGGIAGPTQVDQCRVRTSRTISRGFSAASAWESQFGLSSVLRARNHQLVAL
jgi:hypothetical protein